MRTSHELFEPQGVKYNYGQPQGLTVQLFQISTNELAEGASRTYSDA
jgi:hypothetical protein